MKVEIVAAEYWHVDAIAANARQADVEELWAQARATPAEAMRRGMKLTASARTGLVDDVPVCMFGVTPYSILRGQGVPWMVGSNALDRLSVQKALLVQSRIAIAEMWDSYTLLFNTVDDRNAAAKRWLAWLGFTLLEPITCGPDRIAFRPFYWSA